MSETEIAPLPRFAKMIDTSLKAIFARHQVTGPTCHVGSLINRSDATQDDVDRWRKVLTALVPGDFVGVDLFEGLNVDVSADLCDADFAEKHPELIGTFGLIFASALLEHVANPFAASHNIEAMMRPGGHIYYSGPWVWGYHPYPDDYWRISHSGLRVLFPNTDWIEQWYSGTVNNVGITIDEQRLERKVFAQPVVSGHARRITDRGMPYLNVSGVGRKRLA